MKKIIYMASLLLAVTLWSCSDDEGEKYAYNPTITITSSNLEFTSGGGESVLTFSSTAGNAVSATLDADWCRVTALAGNSATIEVDENTAYESRNARLVLSNGVDEVEVAVMQEGFYLYYDVSTMNKLIGNEASDWHVDFSSPIDDVTFKISSYATNWLSAQSDEGGFTIHCKENTTGKPRWAEVLVQSNGVTLTYTVTQLDMDDLTSVFIFQDTEQNVNQYMEKIPPGSKGLLVQPYWGPGLTTPEARGLMLGFSDMHTRHHMYRAIIEGIDFALLEGLENMERRAGIKVKRIALSGGGSSSDAVCQIAADIFGREVYRVQTFETSGLGASMACFIALGVFSGREEAVKNMVHLKDIFKPNAANAAVYRELYEKAYVKIYPSVRHIYFNIYNMNKNKKL